MSRLGYAVLERTEEIAEHEGDTVWVRGQYELIDVRMRASGPPRYGGHVALRLDDGGQVLLEPIWDGDAIRAESERQCFAGKRVRVRGVIWSVAPELPGTSNLRMPCLSPVERITFDPSPTSAG